MNGKYRIGKYVFENRVDYEKARRDLEFLSVLQKQYPLNQDNALTIRGILKKSGISLQSQIGLDYLDRLEKFLKEADRRRKKEKRRRKMGRFWQMNLSAIAGLLTVMLCAVGVYTFVNFYSSYRSNRKVQELQSLIVREDVYMADAGAVEAIEKTGDSIERTEEPMETAGEAIKEPEVEISEIPLEATAPVLLPEYGELYALNSDLAGWLTIEGTGIDYPVMWTRQDSSYYLSHNFEKEEDRNGLLVLDYRCDIGVGQQNYLIHGHNMRSGTMFGGLKKYAEQSYYQEHKYISFDTVYERGYYEVTAVFISQVFDSDSEAFKYYNCLDMSDEEDYRYFTQNIDKIKLYDTDATTQFGDTFIMLSTCDYSRENGRLVVVARRMEGAL